MSVLLFESAAAAPGVWLSAAGAAGHLHRRQTQVGHIHPTGLHIPLKPVRCLYYTTALIKSLFLVFYVIMKILVERIRAVFIMNL